MTRSGMGHLAHQVRVQLPEWDLDAPGEVALDAGIVEVIQALWTIGVATVQSCEGGPGSDGMVNTAWVSFSESDHAWTLLAQSSRQTANGQQSSPSIQIPAHYSWRFLRRFYPRFWLPFARLPVPSLCARRCASNDTGDVPSVFGSRPA
jgi:hypothetical protein